MTDSPTFVETFTVTAENPLLAGHVIYGRPLLPGVGYVDLVLQVLARNGHAMTDVELRNLTILAPLVAVPGEKVLTTVEGRPAPTGGWKVEVRSRRPQDTADVVHAVANARLRTSEPFTERLALPLAGATRLTTMTEIYDWCRQIRLQHSGLMKLRGQVHHRPADWTAELELAPEHQGSTAAFLFHPALFEAGLLGGGVAIGMLHDGNDGQGLYLPLMFEGFRAAGALGKRCYVRVPVDSVQRDDELIRLSVEFYDENGGKVAEVGRFVAKRIRAEDALDIRDEAAPVPVPALPGTGPSGSAAEEAPAPVGAGAGDLQGVVQELVAARLGVTSDQVDADLGYYELGLASADLLSLVTDLERRLSVELSPTVMFEYKTVGELAAWLTDQVPVDALAAAVPVPVPPGPGFSVPVPPGPEAVVVPAPASVPAEARIDLAGLRSEVAAQVRVPVEDIDPDSEFGDFGLDWTALAQLADRLNERFGLALAPTTLSQHRTVRALTAHLTGTALPPQPGPRIQPVPSGPVDLPPVLAEPAAEPHPMLHRTVTEPDGVAFETHMDGNEPWLRDHRVRGGRVLPGVAHLEMARAAVAVALDADRTCGVRLENVVWLRPAISGPNGLDLRVSVRTRPDGCVFEIHGVDGDGERTLCSQGRASLIADGDRPLPGDLAELRRTCGGTVLTAAEVYGHYDRMGLAYGPAQRALVELGVGTDTDGRPQVLAELRLPPEAGDPGPLALHPSIVDSALQATIGLWPAPAAAGDDPAPLALPFAVERVQALAPTPVRSYAWIRHRPGSGTDTRSARLDVTVFDEQGRVCVELTALSSRALPDAAPRTAPSGQPRPAVDGTGSVDRAATARAVPADGPAVTAPGYAATDIAVIGVSGRYPGAADLDEFWKNLRAGRDSISEVPAERWDHRRWADGAAGTEISRWGGFLDDIDRFDPLFFQISPMEADYLDPQERLFLQTAHHALEDAGYTAERLARSVAAQRGPDAAAEPGGRVGVFVGVMYQEYQLLAAQAQERGEPVALWGSAATVANRVSYFYDFHGPSMAVDTMCSSSLTSIHLACEAIRSGQCEAAIAGGVNVSPHPNKYLMLSQRHFLSGDGRCRSFGEGGDGYVPGEGVGAVVLKPLSRAVADGDRIHGVIKGTALNHGGRTTGYSVPTPVAQGDVIAQAVRAAGVDPRALSYLEAHGTGTSLGDPIEVSGLTKAFRDLGAEPRHLAVGSVKSNIGHTESAAGIAGITKVLLQMRHGELVPSLHSRTLNPHIDFDRTPLHVQQQVEPWRRPTVEIDGEHRTFPRIAGISSFGGGGSNAHVVIAEYLPQRERPEDTADGGRPELLVLSARSKEQLAAQAGRLSARLGEPTGERLSDVAWTLQTGRVSLEVRLALAVTSTAQARALLAEFAADPDRPGAWTYGTARPARTVDREALAAALADWSSRGAHERLLALWTEGADLDWDTVNPAAGTARRVGLPGYPFARERYWLDLDTPGAPARRFAAGPAEASEERDGSAERDEVLLLRPEWVPRDAAPRTGPGERFAERHLLVLGSLAAEERQALLTALPAATVCAFEEQADAPLEHRYTAAARQLFTLVRAVLERGLRQPALFQVVLAGAGAGAGAERSAAACLGGLSGLLKSAQLEHPLLRTQFLECLDGCAPEEIAARLAAEAVEHPEPEVRHRAGRRLVLRPVEVAPVRAVERPWRDGGVYLITGGAGGLGLIVARDIAAATSRATVVLTGRSALDAQRRAEVNALRAAGLTVDYHRVDAADREAVTRLLDTVADNHGPLTGVLHSAGTVDDAFVLRKSPEQVASVLAPKVAGLVNLDELTRGLPLEFFVAFSSIAGTFGNAGQSDYAAGNAFLDSYAAHRNRLVEAGERSGRTVSIGWPLWDEGGMGAEGEVREKLRGLGLAPLGTADGLAALRCALAGEENGLSAGRLLVVAGRRTALLPRLTRAVEPGTAAAVRPDAAASVQPEAVAQPEAVVQPEAAAAPVADGRRLEERAVAHLRRLLAGALRLGAERLDIDTPLDRYGMDSVVAVNLISGLEESFGPLSRTLLFEVQTVRELARYFVDGHPRELRALIGDSDEPGHVPSGAGTAPEAGQTAEETAEQIAEQTAEPAAGRPLPRHAAVGPRGGVAGEDVAIIGIVGRYPGAADVDAFWTLLRDGGDCVTEVPADRWDHAATGSRGRWGAFLDGIDRFDPLHFGISPREAVAMDPQQRLFLESVWHLLESSGVTRDAIERRYARRVGVYVGAAYQMYRADASDPVLAALTSSASYNLIANRVSHFFGLEGPSLAVDSMCTSSTMAVHLACADLQRGDAELAIAGGVNLTLHPDKFTALSEMQLLGTHPGSRSFRDGDGYLPAEAVGAVLLKPLSAALRDGDPIHAVIKGTASMHSGRANGFMTPSHRTQVGVMRRALERAGTDVDSIGYVESAANGTAFADEVELAALREVFGQVTEPVAVGSVKSNLGHPEAASGIAQLTKVVLQLRHRRLAPLVEAGEPNPNLPLDGTALQLCEKPADWEPRGGAGTALRALVNSVAAGGSHVALVVEEAPRAVAAAEPAPVVRRPQLVVVSARDAERLQVAVQRLHAYLGQAEEVDLPGVAWTTQLGREQLPERLAVVAGTAEELVGALARHLAGEDPDPQVPLYRGNAEEDAAALASVLLGARGREFLAGLAADGDLERLADLWTRGAAVPFADLHDGRRQLVAIPATAFEPGRYWLGGTPQGPAAPDPGAGTPVPEAAPTPASGERSMAGLWAELLQIDEGRLGPRSNFFSLGGNSLLATRLINLVKQRTGVDLPVQAVFNAPRLAEMTAELDRRRPAAEAVDALDVDRILASIGLVEGMSDEELDALDSEKQAKGRS
ncbi:SDR family NAD(P)-dependent oxidoreductase [Kitasatospora sp. NPDC101157]|uniref:SDR family NAD(P)-dependent oxidoreductase n=1 Tax=Kitasatospora sp. NPDC101157 TaxID=3364098 RepID=UPI003821A8E6